MRRRRYELAFGLVVVLLVLGVVVVVEALRSPAPAALATDYAASDAPAFTTRDPARIRPTAAAYDSIAAEDAAWRSEHAPPVTLRTFAARGGAGPAWRPAPRQAMQDRVFSLVQAGRTAEAVGELERWVERNPRDAEQLLELARLLNRVGRADDAVARYRQVLELQGGGS